MSQLYPSSHWPDLRVIIIINEDKTKEKLVKSTQGMQCTAATSELFNVWSEQFEKASIVSHSALCHRPSESCSWCYSEQVYQRCMYIEYIEMLSNCFNTQSKNPISSMPRAWTRILPSSIWMLVPFNSFNSSMLWINIIITPLYAPLLLLPNVSGRLLLWRRSQHFPLYHCPVLQRSPVSLV